MKPDPLTTARKALSRHYPDAVGGFVAGSVFTGGSTKTSDIDIAVLYDEPFNTIHRFSTTVDDWPVEFFVHNVKAQDYYFEKDRRRGMCVMPTVVRTGIIIPEQKPLLLSQKQKAIDIIHAGPPPLSKGEIDLRRYILTDLTDDLIGATTKIEHNAILAQLHNALGDFYLRSKTKWSGTGKWLVRLLCEADEMFAEEFVGTLDSAFVSGTSEEIARLVEEVLAPYGGFLRNGFYSPAPDDWMSFR